MKTEKHCSSYILREGRTAGCLLDAPGDEILSFTIWNWTYPLLSNRLWISNFCKCRELAAHPPLYRTRFPTCYPEDTRLPERSMSTRLQGTAMEPHERGDPMTPWRLWFQRLCQRCRSLYSPPMWGQRNPATSPPPTRLLFPRCLEGRLPFLDEETLCKGTSHPK